MEIYEKICRARVQKSALCRGISKRTRLCTTNIVIFQSRGISFPKPFFIYNLQITYTINE